jgi:hypothetical protein
VYLNSELVNHPKTYALHRGHRRRKLARNEGIALQRLRDLAALASWRERHGILCNNPMRWCRVQADTISALCSLPNRRLDEASVTAGLSAPDREAIDPDDLEDLFDLHHDRQIREPVMPARRAGYLVGLTKVELIDIQSEGYVISQLYAFDETDGEHAARRAARRREKTRKRVAECRARKRAANVAATCNATIEDIGSVTSPATSQRERIIAAIAAGKQTIPDLMEATGLPNRILRPWLSRLSKANIVERVERGRYRPRTDAARLRAAPFDP